jgi:hypothetical protein
MPARPAVLVAAVALSAFIVVRSAGVVAQAGAGAFPVGAQSDASLSGYQQLCDWLKVPEREGSVVWNQSLSWTFGYCLYGSAVWPFWYPDTGSIAPLPGEQTYLALSALDDPSAVVSALRARSIDVAPEGIFFSKGRENLWVYRLTPPGSAEAPGA